VSSRSVSGQLIGNLLSEAMSHFTASISRMISVFVFGVVFVAASAGSYGIAGDLPVEVRAVIDGFPCAGNKAAVVKTSNGTWLVGVAWGMVAPSSSEVMQRDQATRAAVVVAKNEMAKELGVNVSTFVASTSTDRGPATLTREVVVQVCARVLAGMQLHDAQFHTDTKRSRVVVVCPPLQGDGQAALGAGEFSDARAAVAELLERARKGLCPSGVICVRIQGSTPQKPKLAFVAISVAIRADNGSHEVGRAIGQAALVKLWNEKIDGKERLVQGQMPDPFDPSGSRLLHQEHFESWVRNKAEGRLPGFETTSVDGDGVYYTAVWCTN
jgi:hypothetical protein